MSASDYGEDLKTCPICGGNAVLRNVSSGHCENKFFREFVICCDDCGLSTRRVQAWATITPYGTVKHDIEGLEDIIAKWNGVRFDEQTNNDTSGTLPEEGN